MKHARSKSEPVRVVIVRGVAIALALAAVLALAGNPCNHRAESYALTTFCLRCTPMGGDAGECGW